MVRRCDSCGNPIDEDAAMFCRFCGSRLEHKPIDLAGLRRLMVSHRKGVVWYVVIILLIASAISIPVYYLSVKPSPEQVALHPILESSSHIAPMNATVGGKITAYYYITNPNSSSVQVGLGMSIRPNGTDHEISDPSNDVIVTVIHGTGIYVRTFNIPSNLPPGAYEWILAIWVGSPGLSSMFNSTGWQPGLTIAP